MRKKQKRRTAPPLKEGVKMRKNCLYERSLGKWVQYDEQAYLEFRRERTKTRMRMERQERCFCPREKLWQCDGICVGCPYQKKAEVSWDVKVRGSEDLTLGEALPDGTEHEDACIQKMYCEDILKKLDELMPQARQIGLLRLEGKSDREIARELGLDRMTMIRMLARVKAVLQVEL